VLSLWYIAFSRAFSLARPLCAARRLPTRSYFASERAAMLCFLVCLPLLAPSRSAISTASLRRYLVERHADGKQYALKQTDLADLDETLRCVTKLLHLGHIQGMALPLAPSC
jgi:hypothetical protein